MRLQYASKLCCLCFPFGSGFMLPPLHACGKSLCFFPVLLLLRTRRQKWQTFSEKISKSFRQSIKTPAAFLYQSGVVRGVLSLVNRCFPCKMRGVFSGLPVTEKFFMDRRTFLIFWKGACAASSKKCYSGNIMFLSCLYRDCIKFFCKAWHFFAYVGKAG